MKNHYLHINKNESGDIEINFSDGVFSGFVTVTYKEQFCNYCEERAKQWIYSKYKNYEGWSNEDRRVIAHKWLAAKELPEGKYEYYFNSGTIQDIFREEVAVLAKNMGITNYTLTVE